MLEPLAAMISPGDWGIAVVSRRTARLLRGGPVGLTEFATIKGELHRRHGQGGWAQARFQRGIEEQVAAHVRRVVDGLVRAQRRRPFQRLVLVCSEELRPVIEHSLPDELTGVNADTVHADLETRLPRRDRQSGCASVRADRARPGEVVVAHYEQGWLHDRGDIAALLRW